MSTKKITKIYNKFNNYIFINNKFILDNINCITAMDRGLNYSDGIFETVLVKLSKNSNIIFFKEHWQRLQDGLKFLNIKLDNLYTKDYIYNKILELINLNYLNKSAPNLMTQTLTIQTHKHLSIYKYIGIKIIITRGSGPRSLEPIKNYNYKSNIIITSFNIDQSKINRDKTLNNNHKKLLALDKPEYKINQYSKLNQIKSLDYLSKIIAKQYAINNDYDDCLLLNLDNNICETSSSNIFFVLKNKTIITPKISVGILPGIIRQKILDLKYINYNNFKYSILEQNIKYNNKFFDNIESVFISNSIIIISPIYQINNIKFENNQNNLLLNKILNILLK